MLCEEDITAQTHAGCGWMAPLPMSGADGQRTQMSQDELFARWEAEGSTPEIISALHDLMKPAASTCEPPMRAARDVQSEIEAAAAASALESNTDRNPTEEVDPDVDADDDEDEEPIFLSVASLPRMASTTKSTESQPAPAPSSSAEQSTESQSAPAPTTLAAYRGKCVVLYTSMTRDQLATVATRKIVTQLEGMGVPFAQLDGSAPENKDVRSELWSMAAAKPGTYPIVYSSATGFVCKGEELQGLIDSGNLSAKLGVSSASPPQPSEQPVLQDDEC